MRSQTFQIEELRCKFNLFLGDVYRDGRRSSRSLVYGIVCGVLKTCKVWRKSPQQGDSETAEIVGIYDIYCTER